MGTNEMNEDKDYLEFKEKCRKQQVSKIRYWVIVSFIVSLGLFGALVYLCPVYTEWMTDKRYLGIQFPAILVLLLLNVLIIIVIGNKKAKPDIVWWLSLISCIASIAVFVVFKISVGGHATTYEEYAYNIVLIEMILQIVSCYKIIRAYGKIEQE